MGSIGVARLSRVYRLLVLGVLACAVAMAAPAAQAYKAELSPWAMCGGASLSNKEVLEHTLTPANEATVQAGTPVTFSGSSASAVTFNVASSPASLSSPDVDSGPGSIQPGTPSTYAFTSTKATATARTVYWTASFSDAGLAACAGQPPMTYAASVRTLTVLPAPTPTQQPSSSLPAPSIVSLAKTSFTAERNGKVTVELDCEGAEACSGRLTLSAKQIVKKHSRKTSHTVTIGSGSFSIAAGNTTGVAIDLDSAGRALLKTGRGRLTARLQIEETSGETQARTVHLIERASHAHRTRGK